MRADRRQVRTMLVALVVGLILVVTGCGKDKGTDGGKEDNGDGPAAKRSADVSGTVKLSDGKPLAVGLIAFHGKDASENAVALVEDGKFTARGAPVGDEVRVTVEVAAVKWLQGHLREELAEAQTRAGLLKQAGKSDADMLKRIEELKEKLKRLQKPPQKINLNDGSLKTTRLTYKISEGSQTIEVTLQP
jgi:hypothetical protein